MPADAPADEGIARRLGSRLDHLDGIRALAALFVVAHHTYITVYPGFPENTGPWFLGWLLYGNFAVAIFIVVSGYSLTLRPARNGYHLGSSYLNFMERRGWRILPAYWASVLLSSLVVVFLVAHRSDVHLTVKDVVVHLFLVQDLVKTTPMNGALWSIAVEWQLYFFFPLFLLVRRLIGPAKTVAAALVGIWAVDVVAHRAAPLRRLLDLSPQFAALFIFGMVAAEATTRTKPSRVPWGWITTFAFATSAVVCAVLGSVRVLGLNLYWSDLVVGAIAAALLAALSGEGAGPVKRFLQHRHLTGAGRFSYSIYLIHAPILAVGWLYVVQPLGWSENASFALMIFAVAPVAIVASYGFYRAVERPAMNRRAQIDRRTRAA